MSNNGQRITDDELLRDLWRVAHDLGHSPSKREYDQHGQYSVSTLETRYGRFNDAKDEAGLDTTPAPREHGVLDPDVVDPDDALEGVFDS